MRSPFSNGRPLSIAPYTMLNMTAVRPMPSPSATTARPETAGCFRSIRAA